VGFACVLLSPNSKVNDSANGISLEMVKAQFPKPLHFAAIKP